MLLLQYNARYVNNSDCSQVTVLSAPISCGLVISELQLNGINVNFVTIERGVNKNFRGG